MFHLKRNTAVVLLFSYDCLWVTLQLENMIGLTICGDKAAILIVFVGPTLNAGLDSSRCDFPGFHSSITNEKFSFVIFQGMGTHLPLDPRMIICKGKLSKRPDGHNMRWLNIVKCS